MFLRPGAGCRGADELSPYKAEHETPVAMLNPKEVAPFCREEPRQPLVGSRLLSGTSLDQSSAATSRGRSLPWQRWTGDSYSPLIAEDARCCLDGILRGRENPCYWDGERDFFLVKTAVHRRTPGLGGLGQTRLPWDRFKPAFSPAMPSQIAWGFLGVYYTLSKHEAFLLRQPLSTVGRSWLE